jgi:putative hydrolase of HD superfamily
VHGESVAEHVFAIIFLAQYFLPLEDPEGKIDKAKLYEISLFHDFGEILNGDIPYHRKTEVHEIQEAKDAEIVFKSLPDSVGAIGAIRWKEYEDRATFEARFAYALDKIEPTFELLDPISEKSLKREKFTYEAHLGKKQKATEQFPVMRRFVDVLAAHIKDRGVFWEG